MNSTSTDPQPQLATMEVQNTGDNSMQIEEINEDSPAVSKLVTPGSSAIIVNGADSNYKDQNSTILKSSELKGQVVTEREINSEEIHSIWEIQTSQKKSKEFETQLNAIDSALKKFDSGNNSTSAMDSIPITTDLNEDISGNNLDSLQGKSLTDHQGTCKWKKMARDPTPSESHMQTTSLGKRNREREETNHPQPTKKIQVIIEHGQEESMVEAAVQPHHHQ